MELAYHYIWKHRLFESVGILRDGRRIEVMSPGIHNTDAGPDFSYARISINGREWVGNVEIHLKASDWFRHSHHTDPAYDNIILHVVALDDMEIKRSSGNPIPQLCLPLSPELMMRIETLTSGIDDVRCKGFLKSVSELNVTDWLESLSMERIQQKARRILDLLDYYDGDWQRVMFVTLARGLGFGLNAIPFELLAKSLPLNYALRHSDNLMQIEALLFGQAGMLDFSCHIFDEYYQALCREYSFLGRKYNLRPIKGLWQYARTRPGNFPHRRIALLARYVSEGASLTDKLIKGNGDPAELSSIFLREAGPYWKEHSSFGKPSSHASCRLSPESVRLLLINVAAPFYFAYGARRGEPEICEKGVRLLQNLPPEKNGIIRRWESYGIKVTDAFRSQGVLQLSREYCDPGRCLDCRFGNKFIREGVNPAVERI